MRRTCGHAYNGHTTTKGRRKKSGDPVRTTSYLCTGYLDKGRTVCVRRLIPRQEIEALVWQRVASRLCAYLDAGGEELLAKMIADELEHSGGLHPDITDRSVKVTSSRLSISSLRRLRGL